jgi:hypothetical protein
MRVFWLCLVLTVAGCGPVPLATTHPSPDSLARAVTDALGRRDLAKLRALALSEREFRDHVWSALPAARPERNLPFSYVWGDLRQKSDAFLAATLAHRGGRYHQVLGVKLAEPAREYAGFRIHRGAILQVQTPSGVADLRIFGSLIEKDGGWKVFSYVVDDSSDGET